MWQEFKRINIRTAAWWDGIAERDLTACADQLAGVFTLGMGKTVLLRESVLSVPVTITNRLFDSFYSFSRLYVDFVWRRAAPPLSV